MRFANKTWNNNVQKGRFTSICGESSYSDTEAEAKQASWWASMSWGRGTRPVFRRSSNVTIGKYRGRNGVMVCRGSPELTFMSHRGTPMPSPSLLFPSLCPPDTRTHTWLWLSTPHSLLFPLPSLSLFFSLVHLDVYFIPAGNSLEAHRSEREKE